MRIAIVGLGYWGPNLVRNALAQETPCDVVVCDVDATRLAAVRAMFPAVDGTRDFTAVLADDSITAVILATPIPTHVSLARSALEAGKSVLVEKPIATSLADALALVELARGRGLLLMAGHTFLFSPAVMMVGDLVRGGDLGEPLYLQSSRVNLGIHQSAVSVLWDLAPHDLSILLAWIDEQPVRVSATGRASVAGQPPDVAFVAVEFESGFVANLHLSWLAPTKLRRMTLVATRKMVVYEDTNSEEPVKIFDKGLAIPPPGDYGEYRLTYRTGDVVSPRVESWEPLKLELNEFLTRVQAGEVPDGREDRACDVVRVIEAAERSLEQHGTPVEL